MRQNFFPKNSSEEQTPNGSSPQIGEKDQVANLNTKKTFVFSKKILILLGFVFLSVLFFDLFISSYAILQFRVIYDTATALIMFAFGYTSMYILTDKEFNWKGTNIALPKICFIIPLALNIITILLISTLNFSEVGNLGIDALTQGLYALGPLLLFTLIIGANATVIYFKIHETNEVYLHKLATYLLVVLATEICIGTYGFYIGGQQGIQVSLCILHLLYIALTIWTNKKSKTKHYTIKINKPDLILLTLTIGIFTLTFFPSGIYNLFGDNAVIPGSALSIINRGSPEPYFIADNYYSPILGFTCIIFSFTTGLDNILLASNLPFLLGTILLPFISYTFLKDFITHNQKIALIGAIVVCLMDGLAAILLPAFNGTLSDLTINLIISPQTASLYSSNICHLWIAPYKIFALTSAIAACCMLSSNKASLNLLGGSLFFLSFINPRFSILAITLLIFLLGLKRINLKSIGLFLFGTILFGGFTIPVHIYKQLLELFHAFKTTEIMNQIVYDQFKESISLLNTPTITPIAVVLIITALIGIFTITKFLQSNPINPQKFNDRFTLKALPIIKINSKSTAKNIALNFDILSAGLLLLLFSYITIHAYSPNIFLFITNNTLLSITDNILLRYHILFALFILGIFLLRFNKQTALTITLMLLVYIMGAALTNSITIFPIIFTILAIPTLNLLIKNQRKIATLIILTFIFLGLFSTTIYTGATNQTNINTYNELQPILTILLEQDPQTPIYSPSPYTYYVDRILKMAHLELSTNPTDPLYIIDVEYTYTTDLNSILSNDTFQVLYSGTRFILLKQDGT